MRKTMTFRQSRSPASDRARVEFDRRSAGVTTQTRDRTVVRQVHERRARAGNRGWLGLSGLEIPAAKSAEPLGFRRRSEQSQTSLFACRRPVPNRAFLGWLHHALRERRGRSWASPRPRSKPQDEPIRLELLGTTDYITDTLTKTRSMFKGRVDKVSCHGQPERCKKGDPLIDLYSKDLAEAKSVFEIEHIQWIYDKNLLETREAIWCNRTPSPSSSSRRRKTMR